MEAAAMQYELHSQGTVLYKAPEPRDPFPTLLMSCYLELKNKVSNPNKPNKRSSAELMDLAKRLIFGRLKDDTLRSLLAVFFRYGGTVEKIVIGSLKFSLLFKKTVDLEFFWNRYHADEVRRRMLEDILPPEIQDILGGEGLVATIRLDISQPEYNAVKQILKDITPKPRTLNLNWYRITVYNKWDKYIADNVKYQADNLIRQCRSDPILEVLKPDLFIAAGIIPYWRKHDYQMPLTVSIATEYCIETYIEKYVENNLGGSVEDVKQLTEDRFTTIGKYIFDNMTKENIGQLEESWIGIDIPDIESYLFGLVKKTPTNRYEFSSINVYAYMIALYLSKDIVTSRDLLLGQMSNVFGVCLDCVPTVLFCIAGILGGKAKVFMEVFAEHIVQERLYQVTVLESFGICLGETKCQREFTSEIEKIFASGTLDLSKTSNISISTIYALVQLMWYSPAIKDVKLCSEEQSCSEEVVEYIKKVKETPNDLDKFEVRVQNTYDFITVVKLLRTVHLFILLEKERPFKDMPSYMRIPFHNIKSVTVEAIGNIDINEVDDGHRKMFVRSLHHVTYLNSVSLNGLGAEFVQALLDKIKEEKMMMANVKYLTLQRNHYEEKNVAALLDVLRLFAELKKLDLSENTLGTAGGLALLHLHYEMDVCLKDNGIGEGISELTPLISHQLEAYATVGEAVCTIEDVEKLQRLMEKITKLSVQNSNSVTLRAVCRNLPLFTKVKRLNLSRNTLESETAKDLARYIGYMKELEFLDVSFTGLQPTYDNFNFSAVFAKGLQKLEQLAQIDLTGNNLGNTLQRALSSE